MVVVVAVVAVVGVGVGGGGGSQPMSSPHLYMDVSQTTYSLGSKVFLHPFLVGFRVFHTEFVSG